ncbi:hypothetical protein RUM43_011252 [Polyplax serrata]|uniref:Uncharacterized protein n=1 Tax=Polyplax serrata TaxID=468196 RepID=A0AAN8PUD6_POLSC
MLPSQRKKKLTFKWTAVTVREDDNADGVMMSSVLFLLNVHKVALQLQDRLQRECQKIAIVAVRLSPISWTFFTSNPKQEVDEFHLPMFVLKDRRGPGNRTCLELGKSLEFFLPNRKCGLVWSPVYEVFLFGVFLERPTQTNDELQFIFAVSKVVIGSRVDDMLLCEKLTSVEPRRRAIFKRCVLEIRWYMEAGGRNQVGVFCSEGRKD